MYEIREATEKYFEGICDLIDSEEELFWVYPNGEYPLTVSQVIKLSKERKELTVAVDDNEVIGFANLYNYQPNKVAFIGNVVIGKRHRGKGLGKEIISYMLGKVIGKYNLPEARISVFSDNVPALLLYSTFGFSPYKIEERKSPKGIRVALIHMKKVLDGNEI
ncbi:MAG TPA: GNAT family N-acetyltransferase [Leucothrix mucor]|uniref:GNAT family N-acetyltransferase n=1 Tax=Leucothrix mucor TaxID=45248 RepID=A0A7V2T0W8_LEUMU|nr:GNAT family N-acetyltransferase [Leucothrix mucor]